MSTDWCSARADALSNLAGMPVVDVVHEADRLVVTVESDQDVGGCPKGGTVAVGYRRRVDGLPLGQVTFSDLVVVDARR